MQAASAVRTNIRTIVLHVAPNWVHHVLDLLSRQYCVHDLREFRGIAVAKPLAAHCGIQAFAWYSRCPRALVMKREYPYRGCRESKVVNGPGRGGEMYGAGGAGM